MNEEAKNFEVSALTALEDFNDDLRNLIYRFRDRTGFVVTSISIDTMETYAGEPVVISCSAEAKRGKLTIKG